MSVYFARQVGQVGPIKIGSSIYPPSRVMDIASKIGKPLEVIACCDGGIKLEFRFHAHFEPAHVGGEWFAATPDLLDAVERIRAGSFDFSELPERGWCITKPWQTKASIARHGFLPTLESLEAA